MRIVRTSIVAAMLVALPADAPTKPESASVPQSAEAAVSRLIGYEPTGLSLLRPYRRDRIPVVFIHGLWSGPWSWDPMIEALDADPALRDRYQFWTFGYSTGDPLLYSSWLLRHALDEARRRFDPDRRDPAFDRMVLVGHSMGGLLAKMMVQESEARLWRLVSDRPFDELAGDPGDRALVRGALFFEPRPEVRRAIFIATPHRGSRVNRGGLERLGARLVRIQEPLRAAFARLLDRNGPSFFVERLRQGLPTSIEELEWGSPILAGLSELDWAPGITAHSVIADSHDPPRAGGSDGLVTYDSAHLDGVASEVLVSSGHLCQGHPAVLAEVRRILVEHAAP
jgi:pimeloyl-ACP methyl ester carboxylesterase